MKRKIGFISFRFAGTDGVTLETKKWEHILTKMNHRCFYMAGELDTPKNQSFVCPLLHFNHPDIKRIYKGCFTNTKRPRELTQEIKDLTLEIKNKLYSFIEMFDIDLIIPQNALTIPLNIPLGIALTELIAETGVCTVAHHHDFFWERKRFLRNCIWDYINACYPPHLPSIQHVVINSSAQNQLALRTGISSTLIPNVMDFESGPPPQDDYSRDVRDSLKIKDDEILLLQPTRVVQRKGIEHALELTARLGKKAVLVISHASGDEGFEYEQRVRDYAKLLGARALFIQKIIGETRGLTKDGKKIYVLDDIYPAADIVTYPSLVEGFGNAFLEAVWFKKPILVNNYAIYSHDIKPKGFDVIEMDDFITDNTLKKTRNILQDETMRNEMVEKNYLIASKYYSYNNVRTKLKGILSEKWGCQAKEGL